MKLRGLVTVLFASLLLACDAEQNGEPERASKSTRLAPEAPSPLGLTPSEGRTLNHGGIVRTLSFSPDSELLLSAGDGGDSKIWKVGDGSVVLLLPKHSHPVHSATFSPDGKTAVTASETWPGPLGEIRVWDLSAARLAHEPGKGENVSALFIVYSPDGKRLISGGHWNPVRIWSTSAWKVERTFATERLMAMTISPDGRTLATGHGDHYVRLWDAKWGVQSGELMALGAVESLSFSPDSTLLATTGSGSKVRIWDIAQRKERLILKSPLANLNSVAFSPDGRLVAAGGHKGTWLLWDAKTGKEIVRKAFHTGPVYAVAFSPDGKSLATGAYDGRITLWGILGLSSGGRQGKR